MSNTDFLLPLGSSTKHCNTRYAFHWVPVCQSISYRFAGAVLSWLCCIRIILCRPVSELFGYHELLIPEISKFYQAANFARDCLALSILNVHVECPTTLAIPAYGKLAYSI